MSIDKRRLKIIISIIALTLLTGTLYHKVTGFGLTGFDDDYLLSQYKYTAIATSPVDHAFSRTPLAGFFRPVLALSFAADIRVSETSAHYHMVNMILHIIAVISLYIFFSYFSRSYVTRFLFSLLWAVHPLMTPAVAWLPGRNDILLGIFTLWSLILFFQSRRSKGTTSYIYVAAHAVIWSLALLTKETAAIIPAIALAYIVFKHEKETLRTLAPLLIAWTICGLGYIYMRSLAPLYDSGSGGQTGLWVLINNLPVIPALLGKMILPINMNGCARFDAFSIASALFLIIPTSYLFYRDKNNRAIYLFGIIWIFLFLLPTLWFAPEATPYDYLEHRAYLPFIGILIIGVVFTEKLSPRPMLLTLGLIVVLMSARNYYYQEDYRDKISFWTANAEQYPDSYTGHLGLARAFMAANKLSQAEALLMKALSTCRAYEVYYSMARLMLDQGNFQAALSNISKAIENAPQRPKSYNLKAEILFRQDKLPQAESACRQAIESDPYYAKAYSNLGTIAASQSNFAQAEQYWLKALALDPLNKAVRKKLNKYYRLTGQNHKFIPNRYR